MNITITRFIGILAMVALPLQAAMGQSVSDFTTSPSEPHGQIISDVTPTTQDIYPVRFTYINGEPVSGERNVLWLKPGEYRILGAVVADRMRRTVPGGSRRGMRDQMEPLEVVIEEGKHYHIGGLHMYDKENSRRQAWRLVLWKVEDGDGEAHFPLKEQEEDDDSEDEEDNAERIDI